MTMDMTAFESALKTHWSKKRRIMMADQRSPFYGLVEKKTNVGGNDDYKQPIDYALPGGGSADIAEAISNATDSLYKHFSIPTVEDYQIVNIARKVIEHSKSDENAFFSAMGETGRGLKAAVQVLSRRLYRSAGGSLSTVSAATSVGTTTLGFTDPTAVFHLRVGDLLQLSATDGTGSLRDSGNTVNVTAIDRQAGTVTVGTATSTAISGAATGDFVFRKGDYNSCMSGLRSYLPIDRSSIPNLHGCVRTDDPDRLAGVLYTQNGEALDECVMNAAMRGFEYGAELSHWFANPRRLAEVMTLLHGKVKIDSVVVKNKYGIGFKGFEILTPGGTITAMPDIFCPANESYMLQLDTWTCVSAGVSPKFLDLDGLFQRHATADAYQARIGSLANLACSAPGRNVVIDHS